MNFDIDNELRSKLELGQSLLKSIDELDKIRGINKLKTKIKQEILFLEKAENTQVLKKEHLDCSNLNHFQALILKLLNEENPVAVLEVFHYKRLIKSKIYVDIVSHLGTKWTKVVARNPKALSLISKGDGEYQRKSIVDHAVEFLNCASQNSVLFKPPTVEFHFACGVENELAQELADLGIYISGQIVDQNDENSLYNKVISGPDLQRNILKLNLDVTAMIAYVSAVTNGHAHKKIKGKVLTEQAELEKIRPVKPILDEIFKDRILYACKTVMTTFNSIVCTIGGPGEKIRADELIKRITLIDDVPCELKPYGQIKQRSIVIFGSGRAIQAITVTANSAFVRAAGNQGMHFDVIFHDARALTEKKELD